MSTVEFFNGARRKQLISFVLTLMLFVGSGFLVRALAQSSITTYFVGCLESHRGTLSEVTFGTTPPASPTCKQSETAVSWANGDILGIIANGGLTGGGASGEITLSLADQGVTSSKLADNAVTTSKLDATAKTHVSSKSGISGSTNISTPPTTMVDLTVTVDVPSTIFLIVTGDVSSETQEWIYTDIRRDGIVLKGLGVDRPTNPMVRTPYSDSVTNYAVGPGTYIYTANIAPPGPAHFVYWENISFTAMVFPN